MDASAGEVAIRVARWGDSDGVAQLVAWPGGRTPDAASVHAAVAEAARQGFHAARTGAVGPVEAAIYEAVGFEKESTLALLRHDLLCLERSPEIPLRRPRRGEWPAIAALDAAAFPPYWHFGLSSLADACNATPSSRVRIAGGRRAVGYVIVGRSGSAGFVQRLAVHPDHAGRGIGSALVLDGLHWLQRDGAEQVFVNTGLDNIRALSLYERLGFVHESQNLVILHRDVGQDRSPR